MSQAAVSVYIFSKALRQRKAKYVAYGLLSGYACAWIGHFILKRINRPALNSRFTVLFQTGVCLLMYYVVT